MLFIKVSALLVSMPIKADGKAQTANKVRSAECIDFINESPAHVTCGFVDLPADHDVASSRRVSIPILIARQTRIIGSSKKAILILQVIAAENIWSISIVCAEQVSILLLLISVAQDFQNQCLGAPKPHVTLKPAS